jgi:hypothetical protein
MIKNKKSKSVRKIQKKGIKAPPLLASGQQISIQDQNKLNFTLTQEEYAHDVSFTSHESPSRTTIEEFEDLDESSDHSCDFNSKSSFKR